MADLRIRNIRKKDRMSIYEHITHVGNIIDENWIWPREDVIESIHKGTHTFYVSEDNLRAEVRVFDPGDGREPYLRTHADGKWNDNLLSLPDC